MELKAAVEEPRIYTNNTSNYMKEKGIPEAAVAKLNQIGHKFGAAGDEIGNVQSIFIEDSSRNGAAIGILLIHHP